MIVLRALLFPFALLYDLATLVRNHLFDIGHKKSFRFEVMVISVGNLNVGGSGKTPMVEHLARLLLPEHKIALLSRGYGRKTKGLRFATPADNADSIGDEPLQYFRKFGSEAIVAVCEDRAYAIPHILQQPQTPNVILLDDAFQHRSVDPQLSLLLTDYERPFYDDLVLPAGKLRERRSGAKRSDAIVVTKCPPGCRDESLEAIRTKINQYAPGVPVYFTGLEYGDPVAFGSEISPRKEIVLVTGIANSKPLIDFLKTHFSVVRHFSFYDHHRYTEKDIKSIKDYCAHSGRPLSIFTTEKDMVKLIQPQFSGLISVSPWFYLPVKVSFLENGSNFDKMVLQSIDNELRKS